MELENRGAAEGSSLSDDLVKTVVIGGILGLAGVLLFRPKRILGHTIPPIIIKSVDDGGHPVEIETKGMLLEAATLLQKKEYKTNFRFGKTVWVEVRMRNSQNKWYSFGFGDESGLDVNIELEVEDGSGTWKPEAGAPHINIKGKFNNFPLTAEKLSASVNQNNRHKRTYKKDKKRRIGKVLINGSATPPNEVITTGYKNVEVRFDDHIN